MEQPKSVALNRDCEAVQIPYGDHAVLPKGIVVYITQTLGGAFTVRTDMGLFRIASKDADALGLESQTASGIDPVEKSQTGGLDEQKVWDVLKTCYDPEIPVNIVDLGLVYDLVLETLPTNKSRVNVKMTLTAPGCGMGTVIARDAQEKLLGLDDVEEANVEIVWDPAWHQSMITAEGRRILGLE
jgi:probable FeS assembly SUF system protein SufT